MKKRRESPPKALHEVIESSEPIATLAGLLEQCGQIHRAELVKPQLIGNAGSMIAAECQGVAQFMEHLALRSPRAFLAQRA